MFFSARLKFSLFYIHAAPSKNEGLKKINPCHYGLSQLLISARGGRIHLLNRNKCYGKCHYIIPRPRAIHDLNEESEQSCKNM